MTSKQLPDVVADDYRPIKRHRPAEEYDDNHSNHHAYPPPPVSGSSGLQFEAESNADLAAKKARKRPLSCGECRRLKLKCDRVFPCQSCCKRGCAEICPDGALTGGKGSRFILANTEQLHEKIKSMSERIRQLEDALQSVYARVAPDEHPLLRQELLLIKKTAELFGLEQQFTPSTTRNDFRREESSRVHNSSSSREGTEDLLQRSLIPPKSSVGRSTEDDVDDITRLSRSFPSPWSMSVELNPGMRQRIRDMLPPRAEAQYLCEQARHNAFWQYNPDASETFLPNLIHSVYTSPLNALLPHRLGLFLMILAIGSRLDSKRCVSETASEKYHHLARVALCEVPVMDDTSFDAVNALFFMEWYLLMFCDEKKSVEYAWGIMGLMTKLAHTIGLHRDGVRSKVIPEELDKRRALFWDLMSMDTRLALMLRRPPSLSLKHVDAKQPGYNYGAASSSDARYHEWHHSFHMQCMVPVVEIVASPQARNYSEVLGLDSQIRDFDVPSLLQITNDAPPHPLPMQRAMTACTREIALLQLHRNYYIHALTSMEEFTVKNKYAPSVLAVYTSACNLIWTVYTLYRLQPELASRYTIFWNNCFSAALALCAFVQKAPSSPLTPLAFEELDNVLRLFGNAREHCASAAKLFPILETIVARCRQIFIRYKVNGSTNGNDETEELCKLVKRTGLLSSQVQSSLNADMTPGLDPFEHAHPTLHRCLEQARMNSSSTCDEKFLARIHALASADTSQTAAEKCFAASFGTEVHESCWMSWF